jgi:hypothetical protein
MYRNNFSAFFVDNIPVTCIHATGEADAYYKWMEELFLLSASLFFTTLTWELNL